MKWSLDYLDLRSIGADLLRNLWVILLAGAAAFLGITGAYSLRSTPEYASSATLAVTVKGNSSGSYASLSTAKELAEVFSEVFQSDTLRRLIVEDTGEEAAAGDLSIQLVAETNLMVLTATADSPRGAYRIIQSALDNYGAVSEHLFSNARLDTLKRPSIPYAPSNPTDVSGLRRLGTAAAVLLAAAVIALLSYCRFTVKKRETAKRQLDGRILGVIPYERKFRTLREARKRRKKNRALLISSRLVGAPFVESFRRAAAVLERRLRRQGQKVVVVTSVAENEGKSSSAANLALALSQRGRRVLLIDGDMRKPALYRIFERKDTGRSLSDCLMGKCGLSDIRTEEAENLTVLYQFHGVSGTGALLAGEAMEALLAECRESADFILVDTPPMNVSADTEALLRHADAAVVTVRQDWTEAGAVNDAGDVIRKSRADFAGYLLNAFRAELPWTGRAYGYYGGYGNQGPRRTKAEEGGTPDGRA